MIEQFDMTDADLHNTTLQNKCEQTTVCLKLSIVFRSDRQAVSDSNRLFRSRDKGFSWKVITAM